MGKGLKQEFGKCSRIIGGHSNGGIMVGQRSGGFSLAQIESLEDSQKEEHHDLT